jgi:glycosyltransferase involved in cell wall biosynthesis
MQEVIKSFKKLGHTVLPIIAGGTEPMLLNSNVKKSFKAQIKKIFPSILWESLKDFILLQKDKHLEKNLLRQIDIFKPDLIYERGNYLQLSGSIAAKKKGIKHFIEINAPFPEERSLLQGKSYYFSKACKVEQEQINLSDKVVVVSSALKDYFVNKYNCDENKFLVTPNAVDPQSLTIDKHIVNQIINDYNLHGKIVIGFVGSIFPYHGVDLLLKSFSQLVIKNKNIHLLIVGDGETLPLLKQYTKELNIDETVTFTGKIEHHLIYNYMSVMDIAIMAKSNWYGSPIKIFEYGAMGKAVIAPRTKPIMEVMNDGEHGILIDSNENTLSSAILKLINDQDLRERLGKNFQKKIYKEHTWDMVAIRILSYI